jgi:hypothetical protein
MSQPAFRLLPHVAATGYIERAAAALRRSAGGGAQEPARGNTVSGTPDTGTDGLRQGIIGGHGWVAAVPADWSHELETMEPAEDIKREPTETLDHPTLGPALAILDDRRRTRRNLALGALWTAVGALGVSMGIGDTASGDGIGFLFGLAGLVVMLYGLNEIRLNALRLLRPVRLIIGDRGFAFATGLAPIMWQDVSAVELSVGQRDPQPTGIQVRVRAPGRPPQGRPAGRPAREPSRAQGEWISIGGGTAMPLRDVVELMREHVRPDARRPSSAASSKAGAGRTSRH